MQGSTSQDSVTLPEYGPGLGNPACCPGPEMTVHGFHEQMSLCLSRTRKCARNFGARSAKGSFERLTFDDDDDGVPEANLMLLRLWNEPISWPQKIT